MARNLLASLALALGSLVAFLGLLELFAARAQSDLPEWLARRNPLADSGIDVPDPDLFWRYRPNQSLIGSYPLEGTHQAKPIRVKTNAFGLRDRERTRSKPPGVFRILSLGESTTFGDKLEATESSSIAWRRSWAPTRPSAGVSRCGTAGSRPTRRTRACARSRSTGSGSSPTWSCSITVNDFLPTYHRTGDGQALGLGRTDRQARRGATPGRPADHAAREEPLLPVAAHPGAARRVAGARAGAGAPCAGEAGGAGLALRRGHPAALSLANAPAPEATPDGVARDTPLHGEREPAVPRSGPGPPRIADGADHDPAGPEHRSRADPPGVQAEPATPLRADRVTAKEQGVPVVEMERIVREMGLPKSETFLDVYHPTSRVHRLLAEEPRAWCGRGSPRPALPLASAAPSSREGGSP